MITKNQQQIIDSLIAEFNSRNEVKQKSFTLINVCEFDEINNLHKELLDDSRISKELWDNHRNEFIENLIQILKNDLGDRLVVSRGDIAMDNNNYSNHIFIYKHDTNKYNMTEASFYFEVCLASTRVYNNTTNNYYNQYLGIEIKRYVTGNCKKTYKNEIELFNCQHTKSKIKSLLNY